MRKIPVLRLNFPRLSAREIFRLSTGIFCKYPSQAWYICSILHFSGVFRLFLCELGTFVTLRVYILIEINYGYYRKICLNQICCKNIKNALVRLLLCNIINVYRKQRNWYTYRYCLSLTYIYSIKNWFFRSNIHTGILTIQG